VTTTNVLLFKFRSDIFIVVRIIKEMPGLVANGTPCIKLPILKKEDLYLSDKVVDFFKTMRTKRRRLFFTVTVDETI